MQSVAIEYFAAQPSQDTTSPPSSSEDSRELQFDTLYQKELERRRVEEEASSATSRSEIQRAAEEKLSKETEKKEVPGEENLRQEARDELRVEKKAAVDSKKHKDRTSRLVDAEEIDFADLQRSVEETIAAAGIEREIADSDASGAARGKMLQAASHQERKGLEKQQLTVTAKGKDVVADAPAQEKIVLPQADTQEPQAAKQKFHTRWSKARAEALKESGTPGEKLSTEGEAVEKKTAPSLHAAQSSEKPAQKKEVRIDVFLPRVAGQSLRNEQLVSVGELAKSFRNTVFPQIVQQASILVDSQENGNLRLVLHPRNLGEVRISLQFEENNIVGRIWVDNANVKDVFEQNLQGLAEALAEKGFEASDLEVFIRDESHSPEQETHGDSPAGKRKEGGSAALHQGYEHIMYATQIVNVLV